MFLYIVAVVRYLVWLPGLPLQWTEDKAGVVDKMRFKQQFPGMGTNEASTVFELLLLVR